MILLRRAFSADALVALLAEERDRWPLWAPVGLGIGVAIYFALTVEPPPWFGAAATAAAIAAASLLRRQDRARPAGDLVRVAVVAVGVVALGLTAAQVRTAVVVAPALEQQTGPAQVSGVVDAIDLRADGLRLVLIDVTLDGQRSGRTPERVRVRFRGDQPVVQVGDRITARAVLLPPPAPSVPGGFDFQRQSFFQGLGAVGYGLGPFDVVGDDDGQGDALIAAVRTVVIDRINTHLEGDAAAVATALMTGERGAIAAPVMAAIRDSGLAHLLAISGLHIGLVAGVLFFGARAALALSPGIALNAPIKKWAAVLAIVGAAGYTLLTGATVPTQRAFLMIALVLLGVLIDRRGLSMRTVAWAGTVILIVTPETLMTASFQLSFAAVTALVAVYERVRAGPRDWTGTVDLPRRVVVYVGGVALTTVIASAATSPYVIYHFHRLAAFGLAANLIAVPVTALWVMPLAVAAFALMPFGLEALALVPMGWGIEAIIRVGSAVSGWPGAVSLIPPMPPCGLGAITLGGLWLCLWRKPWRWGGLVGLGVGLVAAILARPPDILVSDRGDLIAVRRADGGLALSDRHSQRFQREQWLTHVGTNAPPSTWPGSGISDDGRLACDPVGCLYRHHDRIVAFIRRAEAAPEDCPIADVVVTVVRLPSGCRPREAIIDRWDLRDGGVHAIWLDPRSVRIESVADRRGDRPWVVRPDGRRRRRRQALPRPGQ